jgi:hypothetical protein
MSRHSWTTFAALSSLLLSGCSFGVFSDLKDKAPAFRITQGGEIASSSFGDQVVGMLRAGQTGGMLAITGNGSPAFSSVVISDAGKVSAAHIDKSDLKEQLDDPTRITAMAPTPPNLQILSSTGPFVYMASNSGTSSTVRVMDANLLRSAHHPYLAPTEPVKVNGFGLSVAPATLDSQGTGDDIAVGASGSVVLMVSTSGSATVWPEMNTDAVVVTEGTDWVSGDFSVIAAGDLDQSTDEDEVVVAVPEKNVVFVIHHVAQCFATPQSLCQSYVRIPTPQGAVDFGASLLVTNVDTDDRPELVVGSPGSDTVFVYHLEDGHFDTTSPTPPPNPGTLTADAKRFGASLAVGNVASGQTSLLVVGAPGSEVEGKANAGKIFLFSNLTMLGDGISLVKPEENTMLGRRLTVLPFLEEGATTPTHLLAASGREAVFVFFANLTENHEDLRR